jgi:hypothetical protein
MKNVTLLALLAGAIGGAAGSIAVNSFGAAPAGVESETSMGALSPVGSAETGEWSDEASALRRENKELSLRLVALESRVSVSSRAQVVDVSGDDASIAELQKSVAALAAALENPQSASSAGFRQMVASALEEVQTAEQEERQTEREKREVDRIMESMADYSEKLGLDGIQRQSMQDVLIDSSSKRNELFTSMRDGSVPREDIREAFTTQRADTEALLGQILSAQQLEDYNGMSQGGGGFGGGRGGRGGRGN